MNKAIVALDRLKARLNAVEKQKTEPIAIIGMACRFPGDSDTPEAFFRLLQEGGDAVTQVPPERWPLGTGSAEQDPARQGVRWGAFLKNVDRFDPSFFGISPREAERLDPQQRILLEVVWEALERGGQVPSALVGSRTGVFVGMMGTDYMLLSASAPTEEWDVHTATGTGHCFPAGRISYAYGLQGPAIVVDTACSSSLVATHLGCQSLRTGESEMAIVGGVNLMLSPVLTEMTAKTRALAPDGRCKSFDARADGYVRGEGCGVLVLKRLSDAQRAGDPILALIRGSAVNQDGRSTGLTTPNVLSQQAMLRQALESARALAEDIGYVEAHGTGTSLGDPIEFEALRAVIGQSRADETTCVLGAVKTNIGHLEAAAGAAGMIKAVMALRAETIPKNLHFRALNPRISLQGTPFVIPTENLPWKKGAKPRMAGVSSFGMSGTNAHVILEEAPAEKLDAQRAPETSSYLLPISAKSPAALRALAEGYLSMLADADGPRLADAVYTASVRRGHHEHRIAVTGRTREELTDALGVYLRNGVAGGVVHGRAAVSGRPKIVFVFPGQGSQWLGMGKQLLAEEPVFRAALEACDEMIRQQSKFSVLEEIVASEASSGLGKIDTVQPLLFAIEVALAALWRSWGIEPDAVIGHSMGEVAAARVAGILSLEDATKVICRRSRLLRRMSGKGAMALVELPMAEAALALSGYEDRLSVAVSNGPQSTVLSGDPAALDEVLAALELRGVFCRRVKVDVASHSPQMDPLRGDLLTTLRNVRPRPARVMMRSTVTGEALRGSELDAAYWVRNLRDPVLFLDATQRLIDDGHTVFIEMSPHPILLPSIEENLQEKKQQGVALASLRRNTDERQTMLTSLGALYVRGFSVDWKRLHPGEGQCVQLPAYPWQRERYWLQGKALAASALVLRATSETPASTAAGVDEARHGWLWEVEWRRQERVGTTNAPRNGGWLVLADRGGTGAMLARRLHASGATCAQAVLGETFRQIEPGLWEIDPTDPESYAALLREAFPGGAPCCGVVHLFGVDAPLSERTTTAELAEAQILGSESALLLSQAILRVSWPETPRLWLLTREAVSAVAEKSLSVAQAPMWGFGRTLQSEHPELGCKLVDLGPELTDQAIEALSSELASADPEDQIALRSVGRFVARFAPGVLPVAPPPTALRADASYLVTGGLGGLGLAAAGWMVERGARHVILVGRSAPSEAAREVITRMEEAGATIFVAAADASRMSDVEALLARIVASQPPLRGVVHAAGILQDRTVLELSVEAMRNVAAPKMHGAWNLHRATLTLDLDFFVLYSSAASILGSPGQGNYAAANAFLDAMAHDRRAHGLRALSVDWGPFSQVGLAAAQSNRGERLSGMGFRNLTPDEGHDVLGALLSSSAAHVGVVPMDVKRVSAVMHRLAVAPYFTELMRGAARAHPENEPPSLFIDALTQAGPTEQRALLERLVSEALAHVMRLDPTLIERSEPFFSYGFDSLIGLELRNRLQSALDLKLSMADIVTHAQVDSLAELLGERIALAGGAGRPESPAHGAAKEAPAPTPRAVVPGSWVVIPRPTPNARIRLICFPYAGGAASVFSAWPGGLPPEVEVCAVQPPGRHERLHEPMLQTVEEMVAGLVPALLPYLDRPFATFGHCLGAIVMFEVLRELADKHGLRPAQVFASGAPAPPRYLVPSVAARPHEEFLELLRAIGFARAGVLADEDAERHLLPAVKADFELAARYAHVPSAPLDAPLTTFAGQNDPFAPAHIVDEWRRLTTSSSSAIVFPGEHYFIVPEREALLGTIGQELLLRLASIDQVRRSASGERQSAAASTRVGRAPPRARLFCFPGIGQGTSAYDGWQASFEADVEVCTIELPGRGLRAHELPLGRVDEIADHLEPLLREHHDRPFAFVGLDLGALVMFEIVRRLRRAGRPLPSHLLVGAAMAPQVHYFAPVHHLPAERLFGALRAQGLSQDESASAERALRADCAAMASYVFVDEPVLDIPVTAFIGEQDSFIPRGGVRAWQQQTTGAFVMHVAAGAHDLSRDKASPLLGIARAALEAPPFR